MPRYGVNKQIIVGNLGADAEMVYVGEKEVPKASFSVAATVRLYSNGQGETREKTEWFTCVLWGKRAEAISPYLTKGLQVYVEGRTETRSWEDDKGTTRYRTEVRVDDVVFLGGGRNGKSGNNGEPQPAAAAA